MSLQGIQARVIQNTRPDKESRNQPVEKNTQSKPDTQNLHAAPGAPAEPPGDPNNPENKKAKTGPIPYLEMRVVRPADIKDLDLKNIDLTSARLHSLDLSKQDLAGFNFENSHVDSCTFNTANLMNANFSGTTIMFDKFRGARLHNANFEKALVYSGDFNDAYLENANFSSVRSRGKHGYRLNDFEYAMALNANFKDAQLRRASFERSIANGIILSLNSSAPKDDLANEIYLLGAQMQEAQIFLDYAAKERVEHMGRNLPKTAIYMSNTDLRYSTIVNLTIFPNATTPRYPDGFYINPLREPIYRDRVQLDGAYLRNIDFNNPAFVREHLTLKNCRYTPDVEWPDDFLQDTRGAMPIEITDWSKTNLQYHKFDKQFMIQSTLNKTEEEAAKIESIDLSGADCRHADFTDFHPYMHKCKWQGTNIENAKGVHKLMIVGGAVGNPQRPLYGFKSDAEMEEVLRRAKFGAYGDGEE